MDKQELERIKAVSQTAERLIKEIDQITNAIGDATDADGFAVAFEKRLSIEFLAHHGDGSRNWRSCPASQIFQELGEDFRKAFVQVLDLHLKAKEAQLAELKL